MWCSQCETEKPETEFLKVRRGYKVTICNPCASKNVAAYFRSHESDPDKVAAKEG